MHEVGIGVGDGVCTGMLIFFKQRNVRRDDGWVFSYNGFCWGGCGGVYIGGLIVDC